MVHRCALLIGIVFAATLDPVPAGAQTKLRIATYNIEHFGNPVAQRVNRLQGVLAELKPDVIGLEEIKDRAALRTIFPASDWQILIDDASNSGQDVAIAVRTTNGLRMSDHPANSADVKATDKDFLFPEKNLVTNWAFPDRRDLLFARIEGPGLAKPFVVMVHHAKVRVGGRADTDPRREAAAVAIAQMMAAKFDDEDVIILGDFNDNPDDRSANILESGDEKAVGGINNPTDPLFINLTQKLLDEDRVSWGLHQGNIVSGILDTRVVGSRKKNNAERGTPGHVSPILFDQILVTPSLLKTFTVTETMVFDKPIAQEGHILHGGSGAIQYASDHTPVFAEFIVSGVAPPPSGATEKVRIASLLPDPIGPDAGNEEITLANNGLADVVLAGWQLIDKSGSTFRPSGILKKGETRSFTLPANVLPLNNNGDTVTLFNPAGAVVHRVTYSASEVHVGQVITFSK